MMATTRMNFSLIARFALSVSRRSGVVVAPTLGIHSSRIGYLITGGVAKVWCGGGDGSVHTSPGAPAQTVLGAFSPPRMHLNTVYKNQNWGNPKPKAAMIGI